MSSLMLKALAYTPLIKKRSQMCSLIQKTLANVLAGALHLCIYERV